MPQKVAHSSQSNWTELELTLLAQTGTVPLCDSLLQPINYPLTTWKHHKCLTPQHPHTLFMGFLENWKHLWIKAENSWVFADRTYFAASDLPLVVCPLIYFLSWGLRSEHSETVGLYCSTRLPLCIATFPFSSEPKFNLHSQTWIKDLYVINRHAQ